MSKFFSVDSPLYKFMSRLTDVFKLNCMWLLCSLPIVTVGASTTAAFAITLKMVKDEEGYIAGPFLKEFKANLKKGSILGIIAMVACYAIYLDFELYRVAKAHNTLFLIVGIIGVYLIFMHLVYAFALQARYENSVINTMRNSYSIGAKFLGRTAALALLLVVEYVLIMWNLTTMFVGLLIGPVCVMLTISGFANTCFMVVERENDLKAKETVEEAIASGQSGESESVSFDTVFGGEATVDSKETVEEEAPVETKEDASTEVFPAKKKGEKS